MAGAPQARAVLGMIAAAVCACAQVWVNGRVVDENGVAVSGARVEVQSGSVSARAFSDKSGLFRLELQSAGEYRVSAQREGFFRLEKGAARLAEGENQLTVTLNHLQEFAETVDVVYSAPAIDLDEPVERRQVNTVEVLSVPYPAPHDFRNALPLFQGVVQDNLGRAHVNGGASEQTNYSLDGFNISDPVTGRLETRLNIDSVRALELETARFSADKGRASAGSLDIRTKMGDDRFRFGGTNFVPGVSTDGGLHINKWTPRLELSGPIARSRVWFYNGFDAFYDLDTVHGLPEGENRTRGLTANNLTRFQANLSPAHIFSATFLVNYMNARRSGLSFLNPSETTTNRDQRYYLAALKHQAYFGGGALAEIGFADSRTETAQVPQGTRVFEISPFGSRGNYFVNLRRHSYRQQWMANVFLPAAHAAGRHQVKLGIDLERESFHQQVSRHDYLVLRTDDSVARAVSFEGNPFQQRRNFEGAHYVLDRWTLREGLSVEGGMRVDWDQVVRDVLWSPRLSAAWAPGRMKDTKFAAGFGIYHDALSLGLLTTHQDQTSYSTFFYPGGLLRRGPVPTFFFLDEGTLRVPRYRILSASVERKLPLELYGKMAVVHKVGRGGLTFADEAEGIYRLRNWRHDSYDSLEVSVRRTFARFEWSAGYMRSAARTSAVVDYNLENPIYGPQAPGPFAWDTPHRFLTWGWAPVPRRIVPKWLEFAVRNTDAAYLAEYRTGFPFSTVSEEGFMVGPPNSRRMPSYFNINLHFERKFRALHYLWAWRFGFNNLTNNGNPNVVNNNADSPYFLTYGRGQQRAFSVRLRLLGKK
ncbi:MAG: carboxypeptidase regulatory-like domain-containing protein [Bryobacteraceae bacterium]